MGIIGACFYRLGYEYLAPDLPGFGLTLADKAIRADYAAWVDPASDLIDRERREDVPGHCIRWQYRRNNGIF